MINDAITAAKNEAENSALNYSASIGHDLGQTFKALNTFTDVFTSNVDNNDIISFNLEQIEAMAPVFLKDNENLTSVHLTVLPKHFIDPETKQLKDSIFYLSVENVNGKFNFRPYWQTELLFDVFGYLKQHDGYILTEPYIAPYNNKETLMISYGKAIYSKERMVGAMGIDITIDWIQNYISGLKLFDGEAQIFIVSDGGVINGDNKNKDNVGKNIKDVVAGYDKKEPFKNEKTVLNEDGYYKFTVPVKFDKVDKSWYVVIKVDEGLVLKDTYWVLGIRIALVSLLLIIALVVAYLYTNKIMTRIFKLSEIAQKVAKGNLNVSFEVIGTDEIEKLSLSLQTMVDKFFEIIKNIKKTSEDLYISSNTLSETAILLSQGASEQASSTEEVSSSMEQLNANIEQNAENAKLANGMAQKSAEGIETSSKNVISTTNAMGQIAEKISIIDDIAFQTNILALNAAVEAARAGQYGKGFGVVASEVGKLAENSKNAASDIDELTDQSVIIAKKSSQLLDEIMPDIKKTALLIQDISNASHEQQSGTGQINNALQQLNNVTQQNASSADQLANNVEALKSNADQLTKLINFFNLEKEMDAYSHFKPNLIAVDEDNELKASIKAEQKEYKKDENLIKTDTVIPKEPIIQKKGFEINLGNDDSEDEFEKF